MRPLTAIPFTTKERASLIEILMLQIESLYLDAEPEILLTEDWEEFAVTNRLFEKHLVMYQIDETTLLDIQSFREAREFYREYKDALVISIQPLNRDSM